jgi:hypothetical protein
MADSPPAPVRSIAFSRKPAAVTCTGFCVARFCKIDPRSPHLHCDALSFPNGRTALVNMLSEGQCARVLQLPIIRQEKKVDIHTKHDPMSEADSLVWA